MNSSLNFDGGVGYGSLVITSTQSLADVTFSGNDLQLTATRQGTETLRVSDAAEALSQTFQVSVVPAGANDGSLQQAGLNGILCLNVPTEVELTSTMPVSVANPNPAAVELSAPVVRGILTDYNVTPLSLTASTLTFSAGANAIVAPIDVETCPQTAARRS